ncbi:MAG: hypothetical protein LBK55_06875 [Azoarcus sp.]|jgi:hypothetical protein|nr:hypothetical protein [Azoarcus sp.]
MRARGFLAAGFLVVLAASGFFAWQHFAPVTVADGWTYRVYEDGVPRASALALGADADLYYSEELRDRRGRIVRRMADGSRREVLAGLSKPDGLLAYRGGIAIAQEQSESPVYWLHDGEIAALFVGRQIEGLSTDGRYLYAIEDIKENGRILRYDPDTREVAVLRSGLIEGEGIAVCPDGNVFYAEKGRNRIMRLQADGVDGADQVIRQNLNRPGFLFCDGEGLWITEDSTHDARLMLLDPDGGLQVIARRLRAAQTFLPLGEDRFLLADQGRNRILELERLRR